MVEKLKVQFLFICCLLIPTIAILTVLLPTARGYNTSQSIEIYHLVVEYRHTRQSHLPPFQFLSRVCQILLLKFWINDLLLLLLVER